jgi:hypothetical protein
MKKYIIAALICVTYIYSHHAKEYLLIETPTIAKRGTFLYITSFNSFFFEDKTHNHYEFTPALVYSVSDYLSVNIHTHLSQFNETTLNKPQIFVESVTAGFQHLIYKKHFNLAYAISYEYPTNASRKKIEGKDALTFSLLFGKELPHDMNITLNLSYEQEIFLGGESKFSYGIGWKIPPFKKISYFEIGAEITGDIRKDPNLVITPGIYLSPKEHLLIKFGPSIGISSDAPKWGINFAINILF